MPSWLQRTFAPPIFENEEKTRIAQILNSFVWSAIGLLLLIIVFRVVVWTETAGVPLLILLGIVFILGGVQILIRRGYVRGASIFLISTLWISMTYQAWDADGIHDVAAIAYLVIILLAGLLLGWREGLIAGVISIAMLWIFALQEAQGLRVQNIDEPLNIARDLTVIFILVGMLIYLLINSLNRSLYDAKLELKERLRAEEKLQIQANYLTALNETALGLLSRSELQPLLESILARACDLLGTQHGWISLMLPDGSAIQQVAGQGLLSKYNGAHMFKKNEGVTGNVWASGQTQVIQNYRTWDKRLPQFADVAINVVMGVPLKVDDTVIGVIGISYVEQERRFTQEQIDLIERFAALASLAIDNARLYEQAQNELNERKTIEMALRASEERFRKVFQASQMAICIASLQDGVFVEANDAFWDLTGLQPETALGHTAVELGMWNYKDERKKFVEELLEKRSLKNVEITFPNINGGTRNTLAFYELIRLNDKECVLGMFYDSTEQKQAQDTLQSMEARTRAILTSIPDMIFEISSDGTFLDFMASAEIAPIMPPSQFLGRNIKELFPPTIAAQTFFALERALETGQLHAFEYGMPPAAETQFFEARIMSITSESAIIMVRDISQRKWVEAERENLINELEDKNSELERFTYTVSHDLKSPLITIKGFLGFVEQDAASGNLTRLKTDIKRIADATDKMQMLLNELLELSRIGRLANPYQHVSFKELAYEIVELLDGRLSEKKTIVDIQEDLPMVYGDQRRLVEVLQNLVDNAAKFTGSQPNPRIEIGQNGFENDKPILYVKDNGIGIEPIHQERIFGLFNKLDANSDGTGIGLALVKRIIEVHGGRIWVESEVGNGTTFFFTLPSGPES